MSMGPVVWFILRWGVGGHMRCQQQASWGFSPALCSPLEPVWCPFCQVFWRSSEPLESGFLVLDSVCNWLGFQEPGWHLVAHKYSLCDILIEALIISINEGLFVELGPNGDFVWICLNTHGLGKHLVWFLSWALAVSLGFVSPNLVSMALQKLSTVGQCSFAAVFASATVVNHSDAVPVMYPAIRVIDLSVEYSLLSSS